MAKRVADDRSRSRTRNPPRPATLEPLGVCERCGTGFADRVWELSGRWLSAPRGERVEVCRSCISLGDLTNLRGHLVSGPAQRALGADLEILWQTTRDNLRHDRADRAYGDREAASRYSPH